MSARERVTLARAKRIVVKIGSLPPSSSPSIWVVTLGGCFLEQPPPTTLPRSSMNRERVWVVGFFMGISEGG